jgi:diamine N-acetyltransferase
VLKSKRIFLRKLQETDIDFILKWENDIEFWKVSGTIKPYTKKEISEFVTGQHDILENKQIRYVICLEENNSAIGTVDLFEYNKQNKLVGVGILIAEKAYRQKGYADEALNLISSYCSNELNIVTIFCNISSDNIQSIRLFEKNGFHLVDERILFDQSVNYYELKL